MTTPLFPLWPCVNMSGEVNFQLLLFEEVCSLKRSESDRESIAYKKKIKK